MSQKSSKVISLSLEQINYYNFPFEYLEEGDIIYIRAFPEEGENYPSVPKSTMVLTHVYGDALCGRCTFEGNPYPEYGELYEDDFHMVYAYEKAN